MNIYGKANKSSWYNQLREAAMKSDTQVVQRILSSSVGESFGSPNFNGNTALMLASEEGHADIVRILLNNNYASARVEDKDRWTALMCATSRNNVEIVKMLLDQEDADTHMVNLQKNRALRSASEKGYTEIVRMLLTSCGVDANLPNMHGRTALMYAAQSGHTDTVHALLASPNTNLHLRDPMGHTALDLAGNEEIKGLIKDKEIARTFTLAAPVTTATASPTTTASSNIISPTNTVSKCWLTALLERSGFDPAVIKDCVQKLVHQEGFVSETDFAECSTSDLNMAYLASIGVTGLGLQRHLVKLHSELHALYTQNTPTSPLYAAHSAGSVADRPPMICTPEQPLSSPRSFPLSGYSTLSPSVFDLEAGAGVADEATCRKRSRAEAATDETMPPSHIYVPSLAEVHK